MTVDLEHHPRCRRPAPVTRWTWTGGLEIACQGCGRSVPQPKPTQPKKGISQ